MPRDRQPRAQFAPLGGSAKLAGTALVLCILVGFVAEERDGIGGAAAWIWGFGGVCLVVGVVACS
jgi:hypothetical protein